VHYILNHCSTSMLETPKELERAISSNRNENNGTIQVLTFVTTSLMISRASQFCIQHFNGVDDLLYFTIPVYEGVPFDYIFYINN